MPKKSVGIFIKCEKSIKKVIDRMNKTDRIIITNIDDYCCIIYPSKYKIVLEKIEKLQNQFLIEPTDYEN